MKLLLKKDVSKLGLVGDVVEVSDGYARNYLLPQHIAVTPTPANVKALEAERQRAAEERHKQFEFLRMTAERLRDVEVTISAAANPEGVLYGSVGPREVAAALRDEGYSVEASHVQLHEPIKHLDNIMIPVVFAADVSAEVKVWVVREQAATGLEDETERPDEESTGTEAGRNVSEQPTDADV